MSINNLSDSSNSISTINNAKLNVAYNSDSLAIAKQRTLVSNENQLGKENFVSKAAKLNNDIVTISDEANEMQLASLSSWIDNAKGWVNSATSWVKKAGQFALDAAKDGIDFLVMDDVRTLFNPNASNTQKGIAIVSLFPAGKVVKAGKLADLLRKAGKGGHVDAFAGLGKIQKYNSKGILLDGNSKTGWSHLKSRHVTGSAATKGTTLFPKTLGEAKIKNLIMESLEKGTLKSVHEDGTKVYTYNPKKHGISSMTTVVTKDNIIKTSYPTAGTSVKRVK